PLAERFRQTGIYLLIGDAETRTSIVSTDDLAEIAVKSVSAPGAKNQVLAVGGPEILQRRDIPAIFGRIFRTEPVVINVPLLAIDGIRTAVGFLNLEAQRNLGTFRTLLANEFYTTPAEVQRLEEIYDMRLETLEAFIRRYVSP
ncbi:MAG: SDR family NAD(P)-dependent oxidoreductase, partial [Microcoleus sp. SIO2G3]|nr:SDR family NAD(P)-dependent oxidoreductase [Microcoleus sp. SIO2G3]